MQEATVSETTRARTARVVMLTASAALAASLLPVAASSAAVPTAEPVAAPAATPAAAPHVANPAPVYPAYHRTQDRIGYTPGVKTPTMLKRSWSRKLDGQVYAQPLVVGNRVVVATEANSVYAYSLTHGAPLAWHLKLATPDTASSLPCGNISPYVGITGTPVYDQVSGLIFVVTESRGAAHTLFAISAATGRVKWRRAVDIAHRSRNAEQQRGALTVANGRVYVPFGGRYGDCGNFAGYVVSVPTSGVGSSAFFSAVTSSSSEGGMWTSPGLSVAADGTLFGSVGNGAATGSRWDGSDSVVHLSAALRRLAYFVPSGWAAENAGDVDLGSSGPMLLPGNRVLASGKGGDVYLLTAASATAMRRPLAHLTGCAAYGGDAYDPGRKAAFLPCENGLQRIDVGTKSLKRVWSIGATGSPVVAAGLVWFVQDGVLTAVSATRGRVWHSVGLGAATSRFATPVVLSGKVIVGTNSGFTVVRTN
jgi:hypothetical protein